MKILQFTDIHFGARGNSDQHNEDNLKYIDWFISVALKEKVDSVFFLGDWFENRNAINVKTLNYSYEAAKKLNSLGIPIYFIVGNHDLHQRNNRNVFSTSHFESFKNFKIIDEPTQVSKDILMAPFLFHEEYPLLSEQLNKSKYVFGHFEFRNFVVTGASRTLDHGPDGELFTGPKYIFSGHFHKRQMNKNIIYIGNTFPTNFGDVGDTERGCCLLDTSNDDVVFFNWSDCPLFFRVKLSQILEKEPVFKNQSRVECIIDLDIQYSDVQLLRDEMIKQFDLREFTVKEDDSKLTALTEGVQIEITEMSLDETVRLLIKEGVNPTPTIQPDVLIELYESLK